MNDDRYERLRRVARRRSQRGYFTTAQARDAGVSSVELHRLTRRGLVQRAESRVYRFTVSAAPDWRDALAAKLLSSGGIASGRSAAALYGLVPAPRTPEVIVARGSRVGVAGRHTTRTLPPLDCATVDSLRALAPVRMVLDVAHRVPRNQAVALVESAIVRELVRPDRLERRARELRHAKRPGCRLTHAILAELHPELARSRNAWEALVVRRALELGLEPPRLEYEIVVDGRRYIADAAWPDVLVLLEFDGRDPHMRRRVHDVDSVRRNDLTSAGWLRFGLTASALQIGDRRTFDQVARAIAAGRLAG